jgi:hypothetical protein
VLEVEVWSHQDEDWRGCIPRLDHKELLDHHAFVAWVAGVHRYAESARDPSFDPGKPVVLVPDPDNPHDPNALAVFDADQRRQAGWVPMIFTQGLTPWPEGRKAVSLYEHLVEGVREGLGILISRKPVTLRTVSPEDSDEADRLGREVRRLKKAFAKSRERALTDQPDPVQQMRRMLEGMGTFDLDEP